MTGSDRRHERPASERSNAPDNQSTQEQPGHSCCAPSRAEHSAAAPARAFSARGAHRTEQVRLPGGAFRMGDSTGDRNPLDGEAPVHEVLLDAFEIDATSVTNADFAQFVDATGYATEDWPLESGRCRPEDSRRSGAHHRPRGKGGPCPVGSCSCATRQPRWGPAD